MYGENTANQSETIYSGRLRNVRSTTDRENRKRRIHENPVTLNVCGLSRDLRSHFCDSCHRSVFLVLCTRTLGGISKFTDPDRIIHTRSQCPGINEDAIGDARLPNLKTYTPVSLPPPTVETPPSERHKARVETSRLPCSLNSYIRTHTHTHIYIYFLRVFLVDNDTKHDVVRDKAYPRVSIRGIEMRFESSTTRTKPYPSSFALTKCIRILCFVVGRLVPRSSALSLQGTRL